MQASDQESGVRLSVAWQAGRSERPRDAIDRVASYAQALAQALTRAGYAPRTLDVDMRMVTARVLEINVLADVPGLDDVVLANLASMAVAGCRLWQTLPPATEIRVRPRLDTRVVSQLAVPTPIRARPRRGSQLQLGIAPHLLMAVVLGGLLGLFGIPRLGPRIDLPFTARPTDEASRCRPAPSKFRSGVGHHPRPRSPSPSRSGFGAAGSTGPDSRTSCRRRSHAAACATRTVRRALRRAAGRLAERPSGQWRGSTRLATSQRAQPRPLRRPRRAARRADGDIMLSARFRKTGGPPGGGYGFIMRDQGRSTLDGQNQFGRVPRPGSRRSGRHRHLAARRVALDRPGAVDPLGCGPHGHAGQRAGGHDRRPGPDLHGQWLTRWPSCATRACPPTAASASSSAAT